MKQYVYKSVAIIVWSMVIGISSFLLLINHLWINAFLVWAFVPLSWIFFIGSWKDRLNNILYLSIFLIYLHLGFAFGWWEEASWIFFLVPYGSLVLQPKRHPIKYLGIGLTTLYLVVGLITGYWIPSTYRYAVIFLIYLLYYPPKFAQTVRSIPNKLTRRSTTTKKDAS